LIESVDSGQLRRLPDPGGGVTSLIELPLRLSPGRYVLTVELDPTGEGIIFAEIVINGQITGKWYVDSRTFLHNCRDIAFGINPNESASYRIGTISETEFSINLQSVRVELVCGMAAPLPTVF